MATTRRERITELEDLLFPVKRVRLFAELGVDDPRRLTEVRRKSALVNSRNDRVLAIVSDSYNLVTNREALDYGMRCCQTVFPDVSPHEWKVERVDAPSTGGSCHIDLQHPSKQFQFDLRGLESQPEDYSPFVRVTNSYNGSRALGFEIGFLRVICTNGMIIPDSTVKFAFAHSTWRLRERLEFKLQENRFSVIKKRFKRFLEPLLGSSIPLSCFWPISCHALGVDGPAWREPGRHGEIWDKFKNDVRRQSELNIHQLGKNAYALFNVITYFASNPAEVPRNRRERNSLQRRAGNWLSKFHAECSKDEFSISEYVDSITKPDHPAQNGAPPRPPEGRLFG